MPDTLPTTSEAWAACLPIAEAVTLERLRLVPGLKGCRVGDLVWVRGDAFSPQLNVELLKIPWKERYIVEDGAKLRKPTERLPVARLPEATWIDLKSFLAVTLPSTALPGSLPEPVRLTLVRSSEPNQANAMAVTWENWQSYAENASKIRLQRLRFAVASDGEVLVFGQPLPPLPGKRYVCEHGIAIPIGYRLEPKLDVSLLNLLLRLNRGEFALFDLDASYRRIPADCMQPAERRAIRALSLMESS